MIARLSEWRDHVEQQVSDVSVAYSNRVMPLSLLLRSEA